MARIIGKTSKKPGSAPGTLTQVNKKEAGKTIIELIDYDTTKVIEKKLDKIEESFNLKNRKSKTWINLIGLHQTEIIEKIGKNFDIHPLILEDITNTNHRPKFEEFDDYFFIVLKMLHYDFGKNETSTEQVSLIVNKNFVISFQEREGDVFEPVRQRIRGGKGRIRNMGNDYLAYALIDAIVDNYFPVLEKIGDRIEAMEKDLLSHPSHNTLNTIHKIKRELIILRKSIWPLREAINGLLRSESKLISKQTDTFLRDVYDHTLQIIDNIETLKDVSSGMVDTYMSNISNRMNEVMKTLTIMATIFIPLTFIAGIYGMNFVNMPELQWRFGYLYVWIAMILVASGLILFFKKRRWI
jgi:magnesium transporter